MTDRVSGFVVTLKQDIREDDVESTLDAIRHIKGVLGVMPVVTSASDHINRSRVQQEAGQRVIELGIRILKGEAGDADETDQAGGS